VTKGGRRQRLATAAVGGLIVCGLGAWLALVLEPSESGSPTGAAPVRLRTDVYGRLHAFDLYYRDLIADHSALVRLWTIRYRAWNGATRTACVVLPRWYGPRKDPRLPLVISPHGRGNEARDNLHFWAACPRSVPSP
jgi:hypothetical protein